MVLPLDSLMTASMGWVTLRESVVSIYRKTSYTFFWKSGVLTVPSFADHRPSSRFISSVLSICPFMEKRSMPGTHSAL